MKEKVSPWRFDVNKNAGTEIPTVFYLPATCMVWQFVLVFFLNPPPKLRSTLFLHARMRRMPACQAKPTMASGKQGTEGG